MKFSYENLVQIFMLVSLTGKIIKINIRVIISSYYNNVCDGF